MRWVLGGGAEAGLPLAVAVVMAGLHEPGEEQGLAAMPRGRVRGSRQGQNHGCKREPHDAGTESPDGVTSDGAEDAPRLRVTYGEASKEAEPPLEQPSRDTHGQR